MLKPSCLNPVFFLKDDSIQETALKRLILQMYIFKLKKDFSGLGWALIHTELKINDYNKVGVVYRCGLCLLPLVTQLTTAGNSASRLVTIPCSVREVGSVVT